MDRCPVCNAPPHWTCKCPRRHHECYNHHVWHTCRVHAVRVLGSCHHLAFDECTCTAAPECVAVEE